MEHIITCYKYYQNLFCILCLPHSNVDCERLFSQLNVLKTKCHNRVIVDKMNALLLTHQRIT